MSKIFTYSILQYKHSLLTNESINVGILFIFPDENKVRFLYDKSHRVRSIYPTFDPVIFNSSLKHIDSKIRRDANSLFHVFLIGEGISKFINTNLLTEDSTALQFSESFNSVSPTNDIEKTVKDFSQLLIPGLAYTIEDDFKRDENYIVKKFKNILSERDRNIEHKISRNKIVQHKKIELKFEVAWQNGTTNLVKAISFDLKAKHDIQAKSVQYWGWFSLFKDYAELHKNRFDLLVTAPQVDELKEFYTDALERLKSSNAPLEIVEESKFEEYSENAIVEINKHFDAI
jgi:hypothetical protein